MPWRARSWAVRRCSRPPPPSPARRVRAPVHRSPRTRSTRATSPRSREGGFVMLPLSVPAGQTGLRVKYCHDQPEAPTVARLRHTLDLGLYQPGSTAAVRGRAEFRGWSGSGSHDVTVAPNGFSATMDDEDVTRTGRGYLPGPVGAGEWAAELGLASIVGREGGDADGKVNWRVEVDWTDDGAYASDPPYAPTPYDATPANTRAGWYAGDFHVHAEHSRDAAGHLRLRVRAGLRRGCRARLPDALGPQHHVGMGRDRPLSARLPREADRPLRRDHHLPRARQQPRQRHMGRLPHGTDLRAPGRRQPAAAARGPAGTPLPGADSQRRRIHAGEPSDDLPVAGTRLPGGLPRLLLGLHRRRDRLLARRRRGGADRTHRPRAGAAAGAEPLHAARDRLLGGQARQGLQARGGRRQRLARRRRAVLAHGSAGRRAHHGGLRRRAVRDRHQARRRSPPRLREDVRSRLTRPALRGPRPRGKDAGDHGRRRGLQERELPGARDRRRHRWRAVRARRLQGPRADLRGARDERRLQVPLRVAGPRPLPDPGPARDGDRGADEPDLARAVSPER